MNQKTNVNHQRNSRSRWHFAWYFPLGSQWIVRLNPIILISYLLVLFLLISLGQWQLNRRALKLHHNAEVTAFLSQQQQPLTLSQALTAYARMGREASDVRVRIRGSFLPTQRIFLDNRVHHGQAGLHALALFRPVERTLPTVLVNLGWVSWPNANRQTLPNMTLPTEIHDITGKLFVPNPDVWTLEHEPPAPTTAGWLLQKIDLDRIQTENGSPLAPFTLRLTPESWPTQGLIATEKSAREPHPIRDFAPTTQWPISPEKHLGYAIQWFTMAVILSGIFLYLNVKRTEKSTKSLNADRQRH